MKFFDIVNREHSRGSRALWETLNDKKQPWKPWKDYEHSPVKSWKYWHEYPHLQIQTREIGEKVRRALEDAIATRDLFLLAACSKIDQVVLDFVREKSIEVHEKFDKDGVLLERKFGSPDDEDYVSNSVLTGWDR